MAARNDAQRGPLLVLGALALVGLGLFARTRGGESATSNERPAGRQAEGAPLAFPAESSCELGVVTSEQSEELERLTAEPEDLGALLEPRVCGVACDAVREFIERPGEPAQKLDVDVSTTEDWPLPPKDTMGTVAPGLGADELRALDASRNVIVIHTREKTSPKHLALRVCIALAAALAERTHGFVYDEALRRIETPAELRRRVVLGAVTEPSFRPEHIALQAYTQEDGEERMLTLGMARFGAPDLEVRGFREESSPRAALLLNAIAAELAGGSRSSVVSLTTADVARANGKDERAFARSPGKGRFKLTPQEQHSAGDPDNELLTVSAEGTDVAAHGSGLEAALRATTGGGDMLTLSGDLPELVAIGQRVRADLPRIIASYKDHLHLKARFRTKTGTESMWLSVLACEHDACHGPLENEPVASADLTLGQDVRVRFEDIEDYFYELPDGGTIGGDSTRVIQARGK